jgi:cytochrome c-type biogenesis protein CcmH/NrfF
VLEYFAERYGQDVLASPPKSGVNLLAWALPIAGLLAALAAVLLALRAMKSRGDGQSQPGEALADGVEDVELAPYLAAVDRSLELDEPDDGDSAPEQ